MSLVSVIIPYFKKINYIEKTINSVLNQSYKNFQIIIIYDDSNLNDLKYLKKLYKKNHKIIILTNPKNLGAGISRNIGMRHAKGDFIAFLDSDDLWKKDKLKIQIEFMKKNNIECSHTSYEIIDKNEKICGKRISRNFNKVNDLIKSCDIGLSTVVLSKKIIKSNLQFPNLKTKEDFVLWLNILQLKIPIISINRTLTSWRKLDKSLSSSLTQKLIDAFKVYHKHMKFNVIKSFYYVLCLSINFLKK
jgi:teichuronic acid biosynthesis glycosyltransferase TuaG